jgi:chromosome segregation ATPase
VTEAEIASAIADLKAAHAAELKALDRLYVAKHEAIAAAHADSIRAAHEARKAVEKTVAGHKAQALDVDGRRARAETRATALASQLEQARARIADLEAQLAPPPPPDAATAPLAPEAPGATDGAPLGG